MKISPLQLFIAFSQMALSGFAGVLPFAYRALVERRRWLSAEEFPKLLALSQVMPGPIGGGVVMVAPEMQRYVVDAHHWISAEQFSAAYAIAQAAPGPNLLFVTLIGWQVAGWAGAAVARARTTNKLARRIGGLNAWRRNSCPLIRPPAMRARYRSARAASRR